MIELKPAHRPQRIAYIDYTMMIADISAAVTALRLARHERLRTAWMLGGTFVLTAVIGFGRGSLSAAFALGLNAQFDFINNISGNTPEKRTNKKTKIRIPANNHALIFKNPTDLPAI